MFRLLIILLIGSSISLAMDPFRSDEVESEIKTETDKAIARRSSEETDPSCLAQRNNFSIASCREKSSTEDQPGLTMNLSASREPVTPLITLEQCHEAIKRYPRAANLVIQKDVTGPAPRVAPPTFYDHFISAFPPGLLGREKTPDEFLSEKSRQMTREVFEALQQTYGEKIAAASFASAPHRIAIAHPLSSEDLNEILTTAETLKQQEKKFSLMEDAPQVRALAQEIQQAEQKVDQAARATQRKNEVLNKKILAARQHDALHKTHLSFFASRLAALEEAELLAHQETIALKDRLAIARRDALVHTDSDDSSESTSSEGTPLLSRGKPGKQYGAIE